MRLEASIAVAMIVLISLVGCAAPENKTPEQTVAEQKALDGYIKMYYFGMAR